MHGVEMLPDRGCTALPALHLILMLELRLISSSLLYKAPYCAGITPSNMAILLKDKNGNHLAALTDDKQPVSHYSPVDGCQLFVMDERPRVLYDKAGVVHHASMRLH